MKFEITYFDANKGYEQTIRLTGISKESVKNNFIANYNQKMYRFMDIKPI